MKEITVHIPDNKYNFFITLIKSLNFVKLAERKAKRNESSEEKKFVEDIRHSLIEVEQHIQGKVKLQTAKDFINEL